MVKNWYIDKRTLVPGKRNPFLNLASFEWLNDITSQIIYGTTPGFPAGPLLFRNGITPDIATQNYIVEWGGDLTKDTVLSGQSTYDVLFTDVPELTLTGTSNLRLRTPDYLARPTGSILQKTGASGETEFTPYALPLVDGTSGQSLVTDGAGTVTWSPVGGILTGADNGLSVVSNEVYLGGNLVQATTILGDGNPLSIFNLSSFQLTSTGIVSITGDNTRLRGDTQLDILTPNVVGTTATTGSILQLQNAPVGEVEYTPYTFPTSSGSVGQILELGGSNDLTFEDPYREQVVTLVIYRGEEVLPSLGSIAANEGEVMFACPPNMASLRLRDISASSNVGDDSVTLQVQNAAGTITYDTMTHSGTYTTSTVSVPPNASDYGNALRITMGGQFGTGTPLQGLTVTLRFSNR